MQIISRWFCWVTFNATPAGPCYRVFAGPEKDAPQNPRHFQNVFQAPYPGTHHGFTASRARIISTGSCIVARFASKTAALFRKISTIVSCRINYPVKAVFSWKKGKPDDPAKKSPETSGGWEAKGGAMGFLSHAGRHINALRHLRCYFAGAATFSGGFTF